MTSIKWRDEEFVKSSYSGGVQTDCLEWAHRGGQVAVRDTKRKTGPLLLEVPVPAWQSFVLAAKDGEFGQ